MNDDELLIKIKADDAELNQQIKQIEQAYQKALSGGGSSNSSKSGNSNSGNPAPGLNAANKQAQELLARLKLLEAAQQQLAGQVGMEKNLAKVDQEIAGIIAQQKRLASDEQSYLQLLEKEVDLRRQAKQLTNESEGGKGFYSAHSQRQKEILENLGRGGGSQGGNGGHGGSGGSGGGHEENGRMAVANSLSMAIGKTTGLPVVETGIRSALQSTIGGGAEGAGFGGAAAAGLGIAAGAVALKAVIDKFGALGQAAEKLSQNFGDSGSQLGSLRESAMKLSDSQKRLAESPAAAGVRTASNAIGEGLNNIIGAALNGLLAIGDKLADANPFGNHTQDKIDREARKNNPKLIGDLKDQNDEMKTARAEQLRDRAQQEQAIDRQVFQQRRDLALEEHQFEIEQARKVADEKKKAGRENQDYQYDRAKAVADVEFKASEKKYQIDQQAKRRDFGLKQSRDSRDFTNKQADEKVAYQNTKKDKSEDFTVSSSRRAQDASMRLQEIGLKGGDAIDYVLAANQAAVEQQRASEDFAREQKREDRDFGISQSKEKRDFGNKQADEKQDFGNSQKDEAEKHLVDVQTHEVQLKQQLYELDLKHARAVEDSSIALQRLAQDADLARQRFKNQKDDADYNEKIQRRDLAQNSATQDRQYNRQRGDFAGSIRDQLSDQAFAKFEKDNPDIGEAYHDKLKRQGITDPNLDKAEKERDNPPSDKIPVTTSEQADKNDGNAINRSTNPKGIPSPGNKDAAKGRSLGFSGSRLRNFMENLGYDVDNLTDDQIAKLNTGGFIDRQQLAVLHPGEYVINPARRDNLGLLQAATDQMAANHGGDWANPGNGPMGDLAAMMRGHLHLGSAGDNPDYSSFADEGGAPVGASMSLGGPAMMRALAERSQQQNVTNSFALGDINVSGGGMGTNDLGSFIKQHLVQTVQPMIHQSISDALQQYHQQQMSAGVR